MASVDIPSRACMHTHVCTRAHNTHTHRHLLQSKSKDQKHRAEEIVQHPQGGPLPSLSPISGDLAVFWILWAPDRHIKRSQNSTVKIDTGGTQEPGLLFVSPLTEFKRKKSIVNSGWFSVLTD